MRDLVFAKNFENVVFATQNLEGNINYKIPYPIYILKDNSFDEFIKLVDSLQVERVIFDHYEIDFNFEKKFKDNYKNIEIISFDDTYEKHYCDILINHNISAKKEKYINLVPENCEIRAGSKYTLIRDEFKNIKLQKPKETTIFLAMGGADTSNISMKILEVLPKGLKVNLVTTSSNINLPQLKDFISNNYFVNLYVDSNQIAEIMAKSSFAIVSPSVILHEVLYLGLPFIAIKTAENQSDMTNYLIENKYTVLKKFDKIELKNFLTLLKASNYGNINRSDYL